MANIPEIMQKAADALDWAGIGYEWEWDMIKIKPIGQIWTENGRKLRTDPHACIVFLEAIITKMEVENG